MTRLFGLILVAGLWAVAIGCGGGTPVKEAAPPPPAPEEIEENEAMGEVPGE